MAYLRLGIIVLGIVSSFFLFNAYTILSDDSSNGFGDIAAILLILFHLIAFIIGIVLLFFAGVDPAVNLFYMIQSPLNFILMALITINLPNPNTLAVIVFLIIALLEFLPLVLTRVVLAE